VAGPKMKREKMKEKRKKKGRKSDKNVLKTA
jgi:hypothetical protein